MSKEGSTGPRSLGKAAPPNQQRDLTHNEPSAGVIKRKYSTSRGLITIARKRTIIAPTEEIGRDRFAALMQELKDVVDPQQADGDRMLAWILDAGHGKKSPSAQEDLRQLRDTFKSLPNPLRAWLASRATIVVANANSSWISRSAQDVSLPVADYGSSTGTNTDESYKDLWRDDLSEIEAYTAFPHAPDPDHPDEVTFEYFGHSAPSGDDWTKGPVCDRTPSSPFKNDGVVHDVYVASRAIFGNKTASFDRIAVSNLFKAGFLIFEFQEFLKIN